jgi:hypothetical protein
MCRRLVSGELVEPVSFWLLFCSMDFSDRANRARRIDEALVERGIATAEPIE